MTKYIWALLLLWGSASLSAYQWPVAAQKVAQGFLTSRPQAIAEKPLPNLGLWFELQKEDSVRPYFNGEIVYFETSADIDMIGSIPRNIDESMIVQHGKLLFRYSGEQVETELQDSYEVTMQDKLFNVAEEDSSLYIEVFDTQFQTIINPRLILPNASERLQSSQLFVESITLEGAGNTAVNRALQIRDQLPRGIYNLSFRFSLSQGPPLQLNVSVDEKNIYSEIFDQVSGINSRLVINDRDLQDIYITDGREGRFLLGTINLQDKTNNASVRLSIDEENIDGSHNIRNYSLGIL